MLYFNFLNFKQEPKEKKKTDSPCLWFYSHPKVDKNVNENFFMFSSSIYSQCIKLMCHPYLCAKQVFTKMALKQKKGEKLNKSNLHTNTGPYQLYNLILPSLSPHTNTTLSLLQIQKKMLSGFNLFLCVWLSLLKFITIHT